MTYENPRSMVCRTCLNLLVGLAIIIILGFTLCIAALVGGDRPQLSQHVDVVQEQVPGS